MITAADEYDEATLSRLRTLHDFLSALLVARRALSGREHEEQSLVYAVALLRNALARLQRQGAPPPLQVAVIGPTQVGKSTLVNLLIGSAHAQVSCLAGFTRRLQGFCNREISDDLLAHVGKLFPELRRLPPRQLQEAGADNYSLVQVEGSGFFTPLPCIVWDSPDFDSTSSSSYRSLVPVLAATADLIILVVSREKYADLSVLHTLRLLATVDKPLLICINKVDAANGDTLATLVKKKWQEEKIVFQAVTTLTHEKDSDPATLLSTPAGSACRRRCAEVVAALQPGIGMSSLKGFLRGNWTGWTGELRREHAAAEAWRQKVQALILRAEEIYRRDYLRNPRYRDTLQRMVAKLLELLEIPGAAALLVTTRRLLTWPARTLLGLARGAKASAKKQPDREAEILDDGIGFLLLELQRYAGERAVGNGEGSHWWRQVWQALQERDEELGRQRQKMTATYRSTFEPEIDRAAKGLYRHLQEHPGTLNSLRAARFSADAAAVALAIKTGGLGPTDLLLAPALLSFTSLLAESSVGRYMKRVEQSLKERQLILLRQLLWKPLEEKLLGLPPAGTGEKCLGLSARQLAEAEEALTLL